MKRCKRSWILFVSIFFAVLSIVNTGLCQQQRGRPPVSLYYYEYKSGTSASARIMMSVDNGTNSQFLIFIRRANSTGLQSLEPEYRKDGTGNPTSGYYSARFKSILMGGWPSKATIEKLQETIGETIDGDWRGKTWLKLFDYIHDKTDGGEVVDLELMPAPDLVKARIYRLDTILEKAPDLREKRRLLELLKLSGPNEIADMQFSMELKKAYGDLEARLISVGDGNSGGGAGNNDSGDGAGNNDSGGGAGNNDSGGGAGNNDSGGGNKNQAKGLLNSPTFWIVVAGLTVIYVGLLLFALKRKNKHGDRIQTKLINRFERLDSIMVEHRTEDGDPVSLAESIAAVQKLTAGTQEALLKIGKKLEPEKNWNTEKHSSSELAKEKADTTKSAGKERRFLNRMLGISGLSQLADSLEEIGNRVGRSEFLKIDGRDASLADNVIDIGKKAAAIRKDVESILSAVNKPPKGKNGGGTVVLEDEERSKIANDVLDKLKYSFSTLNEKVDDLKTRIFSDDSREDSPDLASRVIGISSEVSKANDKIVETAKTLETMQGELQSSLENLEKEQSKVAQEITDSSTNVLTNILSGFFAFVTSGKKAGSPTEGEGKAESSAVEEEGASSEYEQNASNEHDRSAPSNENMSVYREAMESNVEMLHRQKLMEIAASENEEELDLSRLWLFTEYCKLANFSDDVSRILYQVQDKLLEADPRFAEIQESLEPPKIQATNESNVIKEYEDFRRSIELLEVPSVTVDDGKLRGLRSFIIMVTDRFYDMSPCPEDIAEGILRMVCLRPMAVTIGVTRYNKEYHDMVLPDENSRPTDKDQSSWIIVDLRKRGYVDRRTGDVLRKATVVLGS